MDYCDDDGNDDDEDDDQIAKELHPDDGVDEEEHPHQHAHVGKSLQINQLIQSIIAINICLVSLIVGV